jgi:hypothetical protein
MNTASDAIPRSTSKFEDLKERWLETTSPTPTKDNRTEAPKAIKFGHEVARFQKIAGHARDAARSAIVRKIVRSNSPDEEIEITLQTFIASAVPGRLDDAVDILCQVGPMLAQFATETTSRALSVAPDKDYWYVLIRALGKSGLPSARILIDSLWKRSPEAGVEAFADLGGPESLQRLRTVAHTDPSEFIRQLAAEILEECTE